MKKFEQTRYPSGASMRQHLVLLPGRARRGCGSLPWDRRNRFHVRLSHDFVDVVDELNKTGGFAVTGVGQANFEIRTDSSRILSQNDDAVGEQDGLFNVMGDYEDRSCGHLLAQPQLQ